MLVNVLLHGRAHVGTVIVQHQVWLCGNSPLHPSLHQLHELEEAIGVSAVPEHHYRLLQAPSDRTEYCNSRVTWLVERYFEWIVPDLPDALLGNSSLHAALIDVYDGRALVYYAPKALSIARTDLLEVQAFIKLFTVRLPWSIVANTMALVEATEPPVAHENPVLPLNPTDPGIY